VPCRSAGPVANCIEDAAAAPVDEQPQQQESHAQHDASDKEQTDALTCQTLHVRHHGEPTLPKVI
jgi:hypothetical protein